MMYNNFAVVGLGDFHHRYGDKATELASKLVPAVGIPATTAGQALAVALDLYRYVRTVDYDEGVLRDFVHWLYRWCQAHGAPRSVISSVDFLLEHLDAVEEGNVPQSQGVLADGSFFDNTLPEHAERVACWVVDTLDKIGTGIIP